MPNLQRYCCGPDLQDGTRVLSKSDGNSLQCGIPGLSPAARVRRDRSEPSTEASVRSSPIGLPSRNESIGCSVAFATPRAFRSWTMSCRSFSERGRRSMRVTTSVSPARWNSSNTAIHRACRGACRSPSRSGSRRNRPLSSRYAGSNGPGPGWRRGHNRKKALALECLVSFRPPGIMPWRLPIINLNDVGFGPRYLILFGSIG